MKIALATMIKGDKYDDWFLQNVFPKIRGLFDEHIVVRSSDLLFNGDFSAIRNGIIKRAEMNGHDWIFFLDADEAMFGGDIAILRDYIFRGLDDLIVLPRINFVSEGAIEMKTYPDLQGRLFKLKVGYHFRGYIHETLFRDSEAINWHGKNSGLRAINCPIYHYGWCKPQEELKKKHWREGEVVDSHPYYGRHPLFGVKPYEFI